MAIDSSLSAFIGSMSSYRKKPEPKKAGDHSTRAHSKYAASSAERWFACPGSVAISEGIHDEDSPYAKEGTEAHEVLEGLMIRAVKENWKQVPEVAVNLLSARGIAPQAMIDHAQKATNTILAIRNETPEADLLVETRIYLSFIHPEAFGTFDSAIVDHFGTLTVFDFKYGQGVPVSPGTVEHPNLQMVFYGLGLAHQYQWNFKKVRLSIIQPRIARYDGPLFLEMTIEELKGYAEVFRRAIDRVEKEPNTYVEGPHCRWCKAFRVRKICPLKIDKKIDQARNLFAAVPVKE